MWYFMSHFFTEWLKYDRSSSYIYFLKKSIPLFIFSYYFSEGNSNRLKRDTYKQGETHREIEREWERVYMMNDMKNFSDKI